MNSNGELIVAAMAILLSIWSMIVQRNHNRKTYKPIPVLIKYNYNNSVKILLWNKGNGPMFIVSVQVQGEKSLIDLMPEETRKFTYVEYIDSLPGRVISPGENLNLLEFKIREDEQNKPIEGYSEALRKIKLSLNGVNVHMKYTNIYKDKMVFISQKLDFGNLADENASIDEIKAWKEKKKRESKLAEAKMKESTWEKVKHFFGANNNRISN
jgi:hypothetical protein